MSLTARLAACAAATLLAACQPAPQPTQDRFPAMGTIVEVIAFGPSERVDTVLRDIRDGFGAAELAWHGWGEGELARYNDRLLVDATVAPPGSLEPVLRLAMGLHDRTDGLFEPRIGALTELWGFHEAERAHEPPPDSASIERWLAGELPVRWDLGAFAKGLAVADAVARLRAHGVSHALVNAGGDIAVLGSHGTRAWRVGVRDPRGVGVLAGLELADGEVVFTSGDYERGFEWDGHRYHHVLDPRTGRPAAGTASVTVLHDDAALADVAATALVVAGDDWPHVARSIGITRVMRIRDDGGVELSKDMQTRVSFERPPPSLKVFE